MYPRDELIARHFAHGKCGAVRFARNPVAADEPIYDEQGKRRPRHAALTAKENLAKQVVLAATHEDEWVVDHIVEHGSAGAMAQKYGDRFGANCVLSKYSCEITVYRVRWRDFAVEKDTFEPEENLRDNEAFEDYVKENCPGVSRVFTLTEKTKRDVEKRWHRNRRELAHCSGPLEAAIRDPKKRFERGQQVAASLQQRYQPLQGIFAYKRFTPRLVYLLMDSGSPGLDANCSLLTFLQAIFYVGMGTKMRPFDHPKKARKHVLKPGSSRPDPCVQQIGDIWRRGRRRAASRYQALRG